MPRKKQKRILKPGHRYYKLYSKNKEPETTPCSWSKRLPQDEFDRVAQPSPCGKFYTVCDADGLTGSANLLRPKKEVVEELTQQYLKPAKDDDDYDDGETVGSGEMKLFHQGKLSKMWNQAITEHGTFEERCDHPHFEVAFKQQRGIC